MRSLNFKFRKKNKPTDVLSFPFINLGKKTKYNGDIAISFEKVNQRSKIIIEQLTGNSHSVNIDLDDSSDKDE